MGQYVRHVENEIIVSLSARAQRTKLPGFERSSNSRSSKKNAYIASRQGNKTQKPYHHRMPTPQRCLTLHNSISTPYAWSVSESDTKTLIQMQVDSGQIMKPILCKIDTGAEGNVLPVGTYRQLCPQSTYDPYRKPLELTPSSQESQPSVVLSYDTMVPANLFHLTVAIPNSTPSTW